MSHLIYQNFLTSNTSPTPSTHHSSNQIFPTMMRSSQPEDWTNQAQLKKTNGKLKKSHSSDVSLQLDNLNMKSNGKAMSMKTIARSMLKTLMNTLKQTTGYMATNHTPTSPESQANPHKQDLREKKPSDKFMKKDWKSWQESTLTMKNQNLLLKLCFLLILMIMLTEVRDTLELYSEREVMCISICNFPTHDLEKEECKEVTYRVYSFVTTSQGYSDILSCDPNKHVSWFSDHVITESHGIH